MGRLFRYEPPSVPPDYVERARLRARLAERWNRRLCVIVAGAGFGKSAALADVVVLQPPPPGMRRDVWLSCDPRDRAGAHLVHGLAVAYGAAEDASLDQLIDAVWAEAPAAICFVLDDAHELGSDGEGLAVVERLLEELPANGHLVLASRSAVPLRLGRLAASRQLERFDEGDLVFDPCELVEFARARGVDASLLQGTGGWPALAQLTAAAGVDLVGDYLWEEVLDQVGDERTAQLALVAAVGACDDEIARAIFDPPTAAADVTEGVPLVDRDSDGWIALHALWREPLQRVLEPAAVRTARERAAVVHRRRGRFGAAAELLIENEDWPGLLEVMRDAIVEDASSLDLENWRRALPAEYSDTPVAHFAAACDMQTHAPREAVALLVAARAGFAANDDVDGELAVIKTEGVVRYWANEIAGLPEMYGRVRALVGTGSARAQALDAVGRAGYAQVHGDADRVLREIERIGPGLPPAWGSQVHWLASIAHRRKGDLDASAQQLDRLDDPEDPLAMLGRTRVAWLRGDVDEVLTQLGTVCSAYEHAHDYMFTECTLERAGKAAWVGERNLARALLAAVVGRDREAATTLTTVLRLMAEVGAAVDAGDEASAARQLRDAPDARPGVWSSWYWLDRAAVALPYVLLPETRDGWERERHGVAHLPEMALARAFAGHREDDADAVRSLEWPNSGLVRACLPVRWVVELAVAARSAGNPPPDDLFDAVGAAAGARVEPLIAGATSPAVSLTAREVLTNIPVRPSETVRVAAVGPLEVRIDDQVVAHPHLARKRVREMLCLLVIRRRVRREELADALWPELEDPGRNLRTTLSYLRLVLQPYRPDGAPSFFVRSHGGELALVTDELLHVDLWELQSELDAADTAERATDPGRALGHYRRALPLWRGEPFGDLDEGAWVHAERSRIRARYGAAAVRAGELLLATNEHSAARDAAEHALFADPVDERAHRLLVRAHLAGANLAGARGAVEAYCAALADLGLEPDRETVDLVAARS